MKKLKLEIEYQLCQPDDLTAEEAELVACAKKATDNSYCNYSQFHVGAALRLADGRIVIGANQENAAFPSGLCAERTAIFGAQANFPDQPIIMLAIAARNASGFIPNPITPCGGCLQVILEIEDRYKRAVALLLYGSKGIFRFSSVKALLPFSFVDADMH